MAHLPRWGILRERPFTRKGNYLVIDMDPHRKKRSIFSNFHEISLKCD